MLLGEQPRPLDRELRARAAPARHIGFNLVPGGIRVERFNYMQNAWLYVDVFPDLESVLNCDFDAPIVEPF